MNFLQRLLAPLRSAPPKDPAPLVPDSPRAVFARTSWLAFPTTDGQAVARSLGIADPARARWSEAIHRDDTTRVFVSPSMAGWTLAVGEPVELNVHGTEEDWRPALEKLSAVWGEAQWFHYEEFGGNFGWSHARGGAVERAFGAWEDCGLHHFDIGEATETEKRLGYRRAAEGDDPDSLWFPDCHGFAEVAAEWSVWPLEATVDDGPDTLGWSGEVR